MTIEKDNTVEIVEETNELTEEQEQVVSEEEALNSNEDAELASAKERIAELENKLEDSENRILRLQADFDNFRRRVRLDQEAAQKYRAQNLVTDILPALDNFERALQVNTDDEKVKSILQGVEMVHRQLVEALKTEGVEAIEAVGKQFDPNVHQAVMTVEDEEHESNTVVEVFQKGYILKDRVIRPAMVKVSQ
ncbi:nucleotide exchange factor GrpE [Sutcliffiella sp. NC1]|nr:MULTISPECIES: nucleotide exchange factor GrpE [Sutcliffiella]MED4016473.1 nucleotide exchange factor GrpE [Sutcliffiella cohnii]WBL13875.1 nucleotide exchange factor GrpE [Sutcliffiella sp. NC1]